MLGMERENGGQTTNTKVTHGWCNLFAVQWWSNCVRILWQDSQVMGLFSVLNVCNIIILSHHWSSHSISVLWLNGWCTIILIIGSQQAVTGNVRLRPFLCLLFLFFSFFCLFPLSLFHTQVRALLGIWGEVMEPVCMPLRMNTAMKKPFVPFFGPALKHLSPAMCMC